jgi:hypothetical protein
LAKIETIRDLVYSQIEQPKIKVAPATVPSYISRLSNSANRGAAAEFLGHKPEDRLRHAPVSLRKRIEQKTSFVNPDKQFTTPTLLRKLTKNPEATVDVAKAHTIMSKAEVQAQYLSDQIQSGEKDLNKVIRQPQSRNAFSRTPRTIQNLLK